MLDPITNATALSQIMAEVAKNDSLKDTRAFVDPVERAHNILHASTNGARDDLQKERSELFATICELQHQLILTVTDQCFSDKLLPLLIEHIDHVSKATSKQELDIISMALARIGNAISAYKKLQERKKIVRLIAVVVSLVSLTGIGLFLWLADGYNERSYIRIIMLPLPVFLWSIVGSFTAILYRFTNALDKELDDPLRWLFSRPLTGIIMGTVAFLILKIGFITIQPTATSVTDTLGSAPIMWLIAFIASFSDRFSEFLLKTVVGKFGGDKSEDLINKGISTSAAKMNTTITRIVDGSFSNMDRNNGNTAQSVFENRISPVIETQSLEHLDVTASTKKN